MSDTRQSILQLGDKLLRENGYNAFSYADIAKQLNIKNAAIHYYFPSKTDLVTAIIDEHRTNFEAFKQAMVTKKPFDKVTKFLDTYSKINDEKKICIVGTMATNWASADETIRKQMKELANDIIAWMTEALAEGQTKGDLHFKEEPATKALLIISNMLAAIQLARITGPKAYNTIKATIIADLKA